MTPPPSREPPSVLADRVRRGELVPDPEIDEALRTGYALDRLDALRERAFTMVASHTDRRLAAYQHGGRPHGDDLADGQARPVLVACVPPRPGMEPLIRRSAARAVKLDGDFLAVTVLADPPTPDQEKLLGEYATLALQLGGQLVVRHGGTVTELRDFAREQHATELLLTRRPLERRHPVLRELTGTTGTTEVHVLPVPSG